MHYQSIANTGIKVSMLGLGSVKFGRNTAVKYPQPFDLPEDSQIHALLDLAQQRGINLIDTAPAYGSSEQRIGAALKQRADRQRWIICTKVGEEFEQGESQYHFSPEHTEFSIQRSLKRLNTDYLDIVLVHSNGDDRAIIEHSGVFPCLEQLKKKGVVRAYGMSTKTIEGGILAAQHSDVVMASYNLNDLSQIPVLDYCAQHNTGLLIKKAFASGHFGRQSENAVADSFMHIFRQAGISSIILGTLSCAHLSQNIDAAMKAIETQNP